jgi:hypothetical protein
MGGQSTGRRHASRIAGSQVCISPNMARTSWVIVSFGESRLDVLCSLRGIPDAVGCRHPAADCCLSRHESGPGGVARCSQCGPAHAWIAVPAHLNCRPLQLSIPPQHVWITAAAEVSTETGQNLSDLAGATGLKPEEIVRRLIRQARVSDLTAWE